ncbi:MAG TPA: ATP-dependent DNA helicase RecG [Alphaproteobacteria bacterium]|nr:ATP-dependent DNA helicase RecG [Alphaproteobacteria bacterium]
MRPQILYPVFAPVESLTGVGAKTAKSIEKIAGPKIVDLLWHLPTSIVDRRFMPRIAEAPGGRVVTLKVRVDGHLPSAGPRTPYRVRCSDETGSIDLVYFHPRADWLKSILPVGDIRVVSGRVETFHGGLQMAHPDHVAPPEKLAEVAIVEPVYPMTAGLAPKTLVKATTAALALAPDLAEWQDAAWLRRKGWPGWLEAIRTAHAPTDEAALGRESPARARLAYDELLANQLALALVRRSMRRLPGRPIRGDGRLTEKVLAALPFALTPSQTVALAEIAGDMASDARMLRLLQGDVGSGKTVIGLLAMLNAIETGAQAALLAPTEILARQHFETLRPLADAAGIRLGLLTGRDKGRTRTALLDALAAGEIDIVVGTHALIQESVTFKDLAIAVIDEQHRFGVHQRLQLSGKGRAVDVLVMTATPIPRTLQLTAYGDMEVSRLTDKPPGRKPVDTRAVPLDRLADVIAAVERKLAEGAKVYWVCPLVEESESMDLAAATERYEVLRRRIGERVGLVHGKLKGAEKDAVMAGFSDGGVDVLVATTVIEVGVNVPSATVMVIEHAERFGLAQLHQLRGRIGRGTGASTCLLLYGTPLGETAKARLKTLRDTDDGFVIAEEDLRLRGAGEVLGTRQSGLPTFRLADLAEHGDLLAAARDDARLILEGDPDLTGERGRAVRILLYLFERDAAVKYLRSG